jgi:NAD(P)H-dependent FMN reductase
LVGSLRRDSFNRKLANARVKLTPADRAGGAGEADRRRNPFRITALIKM